MDNHTSGQGTLALLIQALDSDVFQVHKNYKLGIHWALLAQLCLTD